MTDHPITPPPELLQQWATEYWGNPGEPIGQGERYIAIEAARWGADMELEACCEVLARELICDGKHVATDLRASRRPNPPSLKEQSLALINRIQSTREAWLVEELDVVRKALEALPDD